MIFCDMDGVLVDFDGGFHEFNGKYPSELSRSEMWQIILDRENHWFNLPQKEDAEELINFLEKYDYQILTGIPTHGYKKAEREKPLWIEKHIGNHINVICCLSKDKHLFCKPNDILIDDREKMISDWEDAGGIGILHKNSEETIKKLEQIFSNIN